LGKRWQTLVEAPRDGGEERFFLPYDLLARTLDDPYPHGSLAWKTDLFDLRQQIPITGYSYVSELKRALEPAHRELIGRGFLGGVEYRGKSGVLYRVPQDSVPTSFYWSAFSVFGCVVAMLRL
jgi:hypothetical protein